MQSRVEEYVEGLGNLQQPVGEHDHAQGQADAPVTLVEYGDYQCPYCGMAFPVVQELQRRLGSKLRFVFRNFPLSEIHPYALHAAEAAESVAANSGEDAFWTMHDLIFTHQRDSATALDDDHLVDYAVEAGADGARVTADLAGKTRLARVRADFQSGIRSGVNGTPTFFINGERFDGDWSHIKQFESALEAAADAAPQRTTAAR